MRIREKIASFFLWVSFRISPFIAETFAAGLAHQRQLQEGQLPDTIKGLGWHPVPYNTEAVIRVTMEHYPLRKEHPYVAVVDYRHGPGTALQTESWAGLAENVMIVIDTLDDQMSEGK